MQHFRADKGIFLFHLQIPIDVLERNYTINNGLVIALEVCPHSVVRIVASVIFDTRATTKAIPCMVVPINFSSAAGTADEAGMGATNMLDRFSKIKILIVFRTC